MRTPSLSQARSHYSRQRRITAAAVAVVRAMFKRRRPLLEVASTIAAYQVASATASAQAIAGMDESPAILVNPAVYAGVSSAGFPITEPMIATIDAFVPAPPQALPANWWDDAAEFMSAIEQLIASEVQDAGRSAAQAEMVGRGHQNYVRMLSPPSCARCAILAGRIYRDLEAFKRHPNCDCVMIPVQDWEDAHDKGLVSSAQDAFKNGQIRGLSQADAQAIADGANINQIVNAAQGITTADMFGRRVKATTAGTTRRAAWRRANPSRLVRLRPESIYEFAEDREDALRLLRLYGYLSD